MRACVVFLYLLAATFALTVKSKPHGKHHGPHKMSHKEKDVVIEEANKAQVLPTLATFEAHSQEQEDEELSSEDNAHSKTEEGRQKSDKSAAVLLSEEELVDLLKKEEAEEEEAEKRELDKDGPGAVGSKSEKVNEGEGKTGDGLEKMRDGEEEAQTASDEEDQLEEVVEKLPPGVKDEAGKDEKKGLMEDVEGSTEMEIPVDLDYAADSGLLHPLQIISEKAKAHDADEKPPPKADVPEITAKEEKSGYEEGMQNTEPAADDELPQPRHGKGNKRKGLSAKPRSRSAEKREPKAEEPRSDPQQEEEEEEDSGSQSRGKARKQKKNQRMRKHSPQREDVPLGPEPNQQDSQESEGGTDTTGQKAKRRRAGKWGPLVGVNPVQIRATVDLYPSSRPSTHPEAPADPCDNFRCKRGKTCKLDADNKPSCMCQAPSECPPSLNEFDHVCGTDNKTYDTSCELFATKCNLEGTKRGHRLHLDYTGSCKLIPQCVDTELVQFPLRMRDWLKNVLLQLYEHDAMAPGFLTSKQRFRVKKMYESERRLHAGDHSVELLAQDFEKNYNMYIYPVHWQFAQLDQHPSDRLLSHSELAPLRVPLVPMEHCTSRFFQECDADKDKQVSLKEWTSCFGIKDDDIDANLLF